MSENAHEAPLDAPTCSPSFDTPECDALGYVGFSDGYFKRHANLKKVLDLAMKFEHQSRVFRNALKQIKANPGWQDNEVGFMSGHIAAGVLNQFKENAIGEARAESATPPQDQTL